MSNIVPFPVNQVSVASKATSDEICPLQNMENALTGIEAAYVLLTAIQDALQYYRISAVPGSEAATVHNRGTLG